MGLFGSIAKGIGSVAKTVSKPIAKIGGNKIVQAAIPVLAINSSITASTVRGGPKAGFKAAEKALKNPVIRKAAQTTAIAFPAAMPVVIAQEAAIKTLNAIKSKNPQVAAGAALQLAATTQLAKNNPDAARALATLKGVAKARTQIKTAASATGAAKKLALQALSKSPAAKLLYVRSAVEAAAKGNVAAKKDVSKLLSNPQTRGMVGQIQTAMQLVKRTAMIRQYTVSPEARVYKQGRLLRAR